MSLLRCLVKYKRYPVSVINKEITLIRTGKTNHYLTIRQYRNISHGPPPVPLGARFFYTFIILGFVYSIFDIKEILGLRDKEKELQEMLSYTIPDDIVTFSEMPGISDRKREK